MPNRIRAALMEVGSGTGLALGSSRIVKEEEKSFPSKSSGTSTENVKSTDSPGATDPPDHCKLKEPSWSSYVNLDEVG
ncbi:hypothetical protein [Nostoc sp.]|uniref:hypothetical protein n=1 Tax=Nostoc sp. TaxID=1180 RepID=UPI002FF64CC9